MNYNNEISIQAIKQILNKSLPSADIIVLETVDSTNTYAKTLAQNGAASETCVIAKTQTGGKGRLGRSFFSPSHSGIYMSIIVRPESKSERYIPYTIAACVAVCMALEEFSDDIFAIKWVNDIFSNGKKVCGILTEGGTSAGRPDIDYFVVGIGINTSIPDGGFPEEIKDIAGAINNISASKSQIIASVISGFFDLCQNSSIENITEEYKKRLFILGKTVSYIKNGVASTGIAQDINDEGNLIVHTFDGKTDILISGEISLESKNYVSKQ